VRFWAHIAIALAVFAVVSAIAGVAGAANLGTALSFGVIAYTLAVSGLLIKA
jgi:hypothetical protein